MEVLNVTYILTDEQYKQLEELKALYEKIAFDTDVEKLFNIVMTSGSEHDIDKKIKMYADFLKGYTGKGMAEPEEGSESNGRSS